MPERSGTVGTDETETTTCESGGGKMTRVDLEQAGREAFEQGQSKRPWWPVGKRIGWDQAHRTWLLEGQARSTQWREEHPDEFAPDAVPFIFRR